ncbi:unnamed protein product, partial [Thlaspi arvense]
MEKTMSLLILTLTLQLLLIFDSAFSSCQNKCGGIKIPPPFGIGVGCYLNKWYEIQCISNTAFIAVLGKEVVNISFPSEDTSQSQGFWSYGSVRIKNPITSKGCSSDGKQEADGSLLNLMGSPFYVSYKNTLVAVGCNITASLTTAEPSTVGCSSSCSTIQPSPTHNYLAFVSCVTKKSNKGIYSPMCDATSIREKRICNGVGCCQVSIPDELQQIAGVSIEENTTISKGGCKVAFLTDEEYSFNHISDPKWLHAKRYATVELGWFIHTTNASFIDSLELTCDQMTGDDTFEYNATCACEYFANSSYASCACNRGYRGNPYAPGGCKDIDECLENKTIDGSVPCLEYPGYICVNIPGGHDCVLAKTKPIALGIGVSFGSLVLAIALYWLYKFIKRQKKINRKKKFFKRNGGLLLQQQLVSTEGNVEKTKLITGAKPISFLRSQENRALATYFILAMKENKLEEIIDARIRKGCKLEQVTATAKLARKCLNLKGRKRPSMRQVSIELERIRSSGGDSQLQVIDESDEEEETVEVNIGVESWNNVAVTDNVATSFLDVEPLFPRQTWMNGNLRYEVAMNFIIIILNVAVTLYMTMRSHKIPLDENVVGPVLCFGIFGVGV